MINKLSQFILPSIYFILTQFILSTFWKLSLAGNVQNSKLTDIFPQHFKDSIPVSFALHCYQQEVAL